MKEVGAQLLVKTVEGLASGSLDEKPQSAVSRQPSATGNQPSALEASHQTEMPSLKHAPKIFTETAKIHWNKSVDEVHNLIRGLSPFPGAFTLLDGKTLKIYRSEREHQQPSIKPGEYKTDGKNYLKFACTDGYLAVKELQLEGKKRMQVEDFLRGYRFHQ
jgi:methionyl-tRNA formyltransferase